MSKFAFVWCFQIKVSEELYYFCIFLKWILAVFHKQCLVKKWFCNVSQIVFSIIDVSHNFTNLSFAKCPYLCRFWIILQTWSLEMFRIFQFRKNLQTGFCFASLARFSQWTACWCLLPFKWLQKKEQYTLKSVQQSRLLSIYRANKRYSCPVPRALKNRHPSVHNPC